MKYTKEFLKLGIKEPEKCHVCGYGISKEFTDEYVRSEKYIFDCPPNFGHPLTC